MFGNAKAAAAEVETQPKSNCQWNCELCLFAAYFTLHKWHSGCGNFLVSRDKAAKQQNCIQMQMRPATCTRTHQHMFICIIESRVNLLYSTPTASNVNKALLSFMCCSEFSSRCTCRIAGQLLYIWLLYTWPVLPFVR